MIPKLPENWRAGIRRVKVRDMAPLVEMVRTAQELIRENPKAGAIIIRHWLAEDKDVKKWEMI